jgi:thiol-disulfide isomerase/thioredoxin
MKRQKFMITAIVLAVAAVVAAFGFRKESAVGNEMPVQMVNSNNQPVAFSQLKGKVIFVNNWASWCPPCIAEMPSIQELKSKLKDVDVEFVMVSFDEDRDKAMKFMAKRKFDFNVYFPGQEYPFVTSSIPATFIIDKKGNTVMEHTGMTDYSSDEIENQLKALANE